MRAKLPRVTGRELARAAERAGFRLRRQKGSHALFYRQTDKARLVIPMHAGKSIKPKTLAGIVEDMGLTADEFRELL